MVGPSSCDGDSSQHRSNAAEQREPVHIAVQLEEAHGDGPHAMNLPPSYHAGYCSSSCSNRSSSCGGDNSQRWSNALEQLQPAHGAVPHEEAHGDGPHALPERGHGAVQLDGVAQLMRRRQLTALVQRS